MIYDSVGRCLQCCLLSVFFLPFHCVYVNNYMSVVYLGTRDGKSQWWVCPVATDPSRASGPFCSQTGCSVNTCLDWKGWLITVKPVGTALSSVLTALSSVLTSAFRKIPLSGLEKLLEIILKPMHLWGATVRRMAVNHVELVGQERTSGKNRNTPKLSGFLISFSSIYIAPHHSEKETWTLQLKYPGYDASLFYTIISKYCCWVRPVISCESVRQHGPL